MHVSARRGFTLIELLVVIGIIAILSVVVVFTLNPVELLRQSRDSNRISDMSTLNNALTLYSTAQSSAPSFNMGSSSVVYVSIPDPLATSTAGDQCQGLGLITLPSGYTYHCVQSSSLRNVNGTGWIPINLPSAPGGSPISSLPIDPTNTSSSRLYYTYTTNGLQYEITSAMESAKYKTGGVSDVISGDGGLLADTYEKGSQLGLEPLDYGDSSLVGYWPLSEGSGTIANDDSGNGNTLSLSGNSWSTGNCQFNNCLQGGGGSTVSNSPSFSTISTNNAISFSYWVNFPLSTGARYVGGNNWCANYGNWLFWNNGAGSIVWDVSNNSGCSGQYAIVGTFSTSSWHLITGTFNGSTQTLKIYVDGVLQNTTQSSGVSLSTSAAQLLLQGAPTDYFDDMRLYNRALSAQEILNMYNGSK